jgi:hypothetical protein
MLSYVTYAALSFATPASGLGRRKNLKLKYRARIQVRLLANAAKRRRMGSKPSTVNNST